MKELKNFFKNNFFSGKEELFCYSKDEGPLENYFPLAAVKIKETKELKFLIDYCVKNKIPLTARGGGTGTCGGALASKEGIVCDFSPMNKIIDIDEQNGIAVVEPGVNLDFFKKVVLKNGLFYPPDPNSFEDCLIGGNAATNAGGPCALKYGVTRDYLTGAEFFDGLGNHYSHGGFLKKNSTSYNLTQTLCGSEGTLGIFTKIYARLIKKPEFSADALIVFKDIKKLLSNIKNFLNMFDLSVCEFIDKNSVIYWEKFSNQKFYGSDKASGYLIISSDGKEKNVFETLQKAFDYLKEFSATEIFAADSQSEKEKIWKPRRELREAVKAVGTAKISEDIVVPPNKIHLILNETEKIASDLNLNSACYGHIGDGNCHINFVRDGLSEDLWLKNKEEAKARLFKKTAALGGALSGEHGVGLTKKEYLHLIYPSHHIQLLKKIKKAFDPLNLLNPHKGAGS